MRHYLSFLYKMLKGAVNKVLNSTENVNYYCILSVISTEMVFWEPENVNFWNRIIECNILKKASPICHCVNWMCRACENYGSIEENLIQFWDNALFITMKVAQWAWGQKKDSGLTKNILHMFPWAHRGQDGAITFHQSPPFSHMGSLRLPWQFTWL